MELVVDNHALLHILYIIL